MTRFGRGQAPVPRPRGDEDQLRRVRGLEQAHMARLHAVQAERDCLAQEIEIERLRIVDERRKMSPKERRARHEHAAGVVKDLVTQFDVKRGDEGAGDESLPPPLDDLEAKARLHAAQAERDRLAEDLERLRLRIVDERSRMTAKERGDLHESAALVIGHLVKQYDRKRPQGPRQRTALPTGDECLPPASDGDNDDGDKARLHAAQAERDRLAEDLERLRLRIVDERRTMSAGERRAMHERAASVIGDLIAQFDHRQCAQGGGDEGLPYLNRGQMGPPLESLAVTVASDAVDNALGLTESSKERRHAAARLSPARHGGPKTPANSPACRQSRPASAKQAGPRAAKPVRPGQTIKVAAGSGCGSPSTKSGSRPGSAPPKSFRVDQRVGAQSGTKPLAFEPRRRRLREQSGADSKSQEPTRPKRPKGGFTAKGAKVAVQWAENRRVAVARARQIRRLRHLGVNPEKARGKNKPARRPLVEKVRVLRAHCGSRRAKTARASTKAAPAGVLGEKSGTPTRPTTAQNVSIRHGVQIIVHSPRPEPSLSRSGSACSTSSSASSSASSSSSSASSSGGQESEEGAAAPASPPAEIANPSEQSVQQGSDPVTDSEDGEADWVCATCTCPNPLSSSKCLICEAQRPAAATPAATAAAAAAPALDAAPEAEDDDQDEEEEYEEDYEEDYDDDDDFEEEEA